MRRMPLLLIPFLGAPALAQDAQPPPLSPAEQQELERALSSDAKEAAKAAPPPAAARAPAGVQTMLPDISFIADVAFAWFSADEPLQGGDHDPQQKGFNLQQLEMALGKSVDPYFRLDGNIVFGTDDVEIEEIYATTLSLPASLQLRVGQFLTRFGRLNPTHPHQWDFVDQPFAVTRVFGGEGNRGLGTELSWLTPLPWYVELVGSVTNPPGELAVERLDDFQFLLAIKQFFALSDDLSLFVGLSAATAASPTETDADARTDIYGADLYFKFRPITRESTTQVTLQAELFWRRRHLDEATLTDLSAYAQTTWRFARRWTAGARWEWGNAADGDVPDPQDPEWTEARHRLTADVSFFPTEFSRIRVQGSADLVPWRDDPIWAFFTAFEFSVGVHGAHKF